MLHFMAAAEGDLAAHLKAWNAKRKPPDKPEPLYHVGGQAVYPSSYVGDRKWFEEVEEAARFLTIDLGVRYGSLDITIQRWALTCGD